MLLAAIGFASAGKDTVAKYIESREDFVKDSFASSLKDVTAALFNWPRDLVEGDTDVSRAWRETVDEWWAKNLGIPDFTPRLALQRIGTEVFRNNFHQSTWLMTFRNRLETVNAGKNVIVSDCRFKNEIQFFKDSGGKFIFVDNGDRPEWHETAMMANKGIGVESVKALLEMTTTKYSHVHRSEWDWIGMTPDVVIRNDFEHRNKETYKILLDRVDRALQDLK